ncbi:MAG TPA: GntR family transcriptional regulator [Thermoleophilaceae bacterium]
MQRPDLAAPSALWENIADLIRAAILSGELEPGSKLIETELAERFGTSRGPIREAIRELAREGLVTELPRRGSLVSTLTAHDLSEVYAVRQALEVAASRVVIARARDDELHALETHLEALESPPPGAGYLDQAVHDLAFHRSLVALARNERMATMYEQMLTQTMLLLRTASLENPALRTDLRRAAHRDILQALIDRDEAAARAALEAHYRYAEERLFPGVTVRG